MESPLSAFKRLMSERESRTLKCNITFVLSKKAFHSFHQFKLKSHFVLKFPTNGSKRDNRANCDVKTIFKTNLSK